MGQRKSSEEFRAEAVRQVLERAYPFADVAARADFDSCTNSHRRRMRIAWMSESATTGLDSRGAAT
jgi:transposase-like protein